MKSETGNETFTQTRSTWLTLTGAGLLWAAACLWAFSAVDFDAGADRPGSAQEAAMLALEAEEQIRLEAQEKAAERRQSAAAEASRQVESEAKAFAEQDANRAAEAQELAKQQALAEAAEADRLAEEVRLAAEAEAAEEARLAAEAEAVEAARLAAEAEAAEEARLAAEAEAVEAARQVAEAEAAEEARLVAEAEAAEQERAREAAEARRLAASTSQSTGVDERARQAAAAEASRIAALARQQRNYYASTRDQELRVLAGLSARLRFAPDSATVSREIERTLDDIFNPLYLYSEAYIRVSVATNEYDGTTKDGLLSRDRGRAIASYLINRGLEKERFRIHIETGEQLPTGTHRIRVSAEEVRK